MCSRETGTFKNFEDFDENLLPDVRLYGYIFMGGTLYLFTYRIYYIIHTPKKISKVRRSHLKLFSTKVHWKILQNLQE